MTRPAISPFQIPVPGGALAGEQRPGTAPIVFVHGFGGRMQDWDMIWDRLDLPGRRLIRHDLRGFGASSEDDPRPFSHERDLLALLDALDIEKASLVGLSMGGAIATGFALDHPGRVERLALISPGLRAWDWSEDWRAQWDAIEAEARAGRMDAAHALWWQHPLFRTTRQSDACEALRRSMDAYAGRQWIVDHQSPVMPDIERLHELDVPTLLLSGARDLPDFRLIADLMQGAAPDLVRHDLEGAGHLLNFERPAEAARHIEAHLAR